jgi:uncharacterized membrane protein required for colicin V production
MSWFIDIAIALIGVLVIVHYSRKGFVKAATDILSFFIAIAFAFLLAKFLSPIIFNAFLSEPISNALQSKIDQINPTQFGQLVSSLPGFAGSLISGLNVSNSLETGISGLSGEKITETIVKPILVEPLAIIIFLILLLPMTPLVRLFLRPVNALFKAPVLKQLNTVFGFVFGIAIAVLAVFVVSLLAFTFAGIAETTPPEPRQPFVQAVYDSFFVRIAQGINIF